MRISPPCCDISSGSNNAFWLCNTSVRRSGADDRAPPEPPILRSSTINLEKVQPPASEAVSAFPDTIVCGPRPLKSCWQESIQRLTAPPNFRITNKNAHGEIAAHLAAIARRRTSCLLPKIGRVSCRERVCQYV